MTNGKETFQQRVARIRAARPDSHFSPVPSLSAVDMGDLGTFRRNASAVSWGQITDSPFEASAVRYGFPIVIAVLGLAMLSAFVPTAGHTVAATDATVIERTDTFVADQNAIDSN